MKKIIANVLILLVLFIVSHHGINAQNFTETVRIEPNNYGPKLILNDPNTANKVPIEFRVNDVVKWELGQRPADENHDLVLWKYNGSYSPVMWFDHATGYVGVGTSDPQSKLQVGVTHTVDQDEEMRIGSYYQSNFYGIGFNYRINSTGAVSKHLVEYYAGNRTTSMSFNNGNVGIGTTSPLHKLQVGTIGGMGNTNFNIVGSMGVAAIDDATRKAVYLWSDGSTFKLDAFDYGASTALDLGIVDNGGDLNIGNGDLFVANSEGKVGVGTINPLHKLQVGTIGGMGNANFNIVGSVGVAAIDDATRKAVYLWSDGSTFKLDAFDYGTSTALDLGIVDNGGDLNIGNGDLFVANSEGNVGIGTTSPDYKLDVLGTIRAEEIKVETGWSDFVFHDDYHLRSLEEVEQFIAVNNHLPEIPSEKEVKKNGISLGEMDAKLLQKIEELTLYVIEQNKTQKELIKEVKALKEKNAQLEEKLELNNY